jgi:hypothetical protein
VRRFGTLVCALAVFQLLGGPLAALQAVAWLGMAITYSQTDGISAGIVKTFDGEHPCSLCKVIAKKRDTQQKDIANLSLTKIYLLCPRSRARLFPPAEYWLQSATDLVHSGSMLEPLLQPPRMS